ncbi:hypothetical protein SAICODRAFT_66312 [Saitoella complicata NRRL Y-17804]|uniref:uncharacterized protein n=1 Tax=Saitoella complicata (strain BCRC 22490 / CBS 7301 / JCM 7358 / NBRC 10748 / NRRL Y-17804) TaxID=698492 RepID=UPI000866E225|nr:uncharacterized protein SAICODRAFT_66312 [Saitoella complicata NRRL Y-17804]ODQ52343.1 hypothetical protein SAICODRAFT_66312 [Saitoella complicata NRRL Y-17804]
MTMPSGSSIITIIKFSGSLAVTTVPAVASPPFVSVRASAPAPALVLAPSSALTPTPTAVWTRVSALALPYRGMRRRGIVLRHDSSLTPTSAPSRSRIPSHLLPYRRVHRCDICFRRSNTGSLTNGLAVPLWAP